MKRNWPTVEMAETVIEEHQQYTTPLLPGFQLPLSKLLEIADALGDSDDPLAAIHFPAR